MPEGHTIHRLARDQNRDIAGARVAACSPQGRFEDGAAEIDGRVLDRVEAYGKHLFYWWRDAELVHVHLGLYGRFRRHKSPPPEPRGQVRWRVVGPEKSFDLIGPTACELIDEDGRRELIDRLGEDPLRDDADPERARKRILSSRAPIGALLLNQSVIAGVGNVFRADALHKVGIHPARLGKELTDDEFDELWSTLRSMLRTGVKYNRIITADASELGTTPGRLKRGERLRIYKKELCPSCESPIRRWTLAARTVFACEECQPA